MNMDMGIAKAILPSKADIMAMAPVFAEAGQSVYDDWEPGEDDDLAGGGICDLIAGRIVDLIEGAYPSSKVLSSLVSTEQHVVTIMAVREGVIEIDIPYSQYEFGAGFSWTKRPDVVFGADMVTFTDLDADPKKIIQYADGLEAMHMFPEYVSDDAIEEGKVSRGTFLKAVEALQSDAARLDAGKKEPGPAKSPSPAP